jgi:predicted enzyme related to lactoylglutathione lyase
MRTSDLAARPDFDLTVPGPVGLAFGARDVRRIYYRLSGAGVEFHASPGEDDADADLAVYGRAYDGEYIVLQTQHEGTVSPYFGVTEPLEVVLVVRDMEASANFLVDCLEQELLEQGLVDDEGVRRTMGLSPGTAFHWRTFAAAPRSAPRLRLICFGDGQSQQVVNPPSRGLSALRFHVGDLDRSLARAQRAGAQVTVSKTDVAHPAVGTGLMAGLSTPLGVRLELWRPRPG